MLEPFPVRTANGVVWIEYEVQVYCEELDSNLQCYVLDDSPALISVGKLCKESGFNWLWQAYSDTPTLTKDGQVVSCRTVNNVPLITLASSSPAEACGGDSVKAEEQEAKGGDSSGGGAS